MPVERCDALPNDRPATSRTGHGPRLEVDLAALAANWRTLASEAAQAVCSAVVKADAYGLGLEPCARALLKAGCRTFFVAHLDEGLALRRIAGPVPEIFVLNGFLGERREDYCAGALVPVLNTAGEARAWAEAPPLAAALQVETGMNRLGLARDEARAFLAALPAEAAMRVTLLMSHLACADEPAHPQNAAQRARLAGLGDVLPHARRSLANSGGIVLGPAFHFDLVRPGIALYGGAAGARGALRTVARLHARVLQVKEVPPGEGVGYGATSRADGPRRIATVSAGYADGILRSLSGCGVAHVGGILAPYAGRVSMDSLALDISSAEPDAVREGDEAELFGDAVSVDALAARAGTISYELLARLGGRLLKVYK
ncbi:MAG: alanine racemase [Alphaproteobacteria bacterium]|nr:alanine racemase [Alphaproteobacteria bacterium]